jgi:hypothetical protein
MDLLKYREESRRVEERRGEHKGTSNPHCGGKARDTGRLCDRTDTFGRKNCNSFVVLIEGNDFLPPFFSHQVVHCMSHCMGWGWRWMEMDGERDERPHSRHKCRVEGGDGTLDPY